MIFVSVTVSECYRLLTLKPVAGRCHFYLSTFAQGLYMILFEITVRLLKNYSLKTIVTQG